MFWKTETSFHWYKAVILALALLIMPTHKLLTNEYSTVEVAEHRVMWDDVAIEVIQHVKNLIT